MKKVFVSDCEGPISKNDNAFEITAYYVPEGEKFFTVISRYDDVLAYVLKRRGYKAGDTLKLILPFLRAYGVTDEKMREFSAKSLVLIPKAKEMLHHVRRLAHAFIVSTSYEHYIRALCQAVEFPYRNTYCTKLKISKYRIEKGEKKRLMELAKEIAQMPIIEILENAKSLEDFPAEHRKAVLRLDEIFWKEIANMKSGRRFLYDVNPVGGAEKAEAILDVIKKVGAKLSDVMYVGDSITDIEVFKLVKENDGLAVSFNGNRYAVENAEIAILSNNCMPTAIIAELFTRLGKEQTLKIVENWSLENLKRAEVSSTLIESLLKFGDLPKVKIITKENIEALAKESSEFRKKVRGEAIGRLG
ncbi:MAG: HAD hydrolase family protein [Candidatus Bathyarchaeales archaeon]